MFLVIFNLFDVMVHQYAYLSCKFQLRTALLPANDTECLRSKSIDLLRCAENTIIKFVRETVSGGAEAGGLGIFNSFIPDVNKCK